mmetsp:Transcript_4154/g.10786  ORF Transcript_4154/g.10786 Transcript_4154/m.10786 type:complete len:234 (+) Transcript_4154:1232-1933(+)
MLLIVHKILAQLLSQAWRHTQPLQVISEDVLLLDEAQLILVDSVEHLDDGGDAVCVDGSASDHDKCGKDALVLIGRRDVAVPDRAHRGERPVERRRVHGRRAPVRRCSALNIQPGEYLAMAGRFPIYLAERIPDARVHVRKRQCRGDKGYQHLRGLLQCGLHLEPCTHAPQAKQANGAQATNAIDQLSNSWFAAKGSQHQIKRDCREHIWYEPCFQVVDANLLRVELNGAIAS